MSFVAILKETGQIFMVHGETRMGDIVHDAHPPIRPDAQYAGYLLEVRIKPDTKDFGIIRATPGVLAVMSGDQLIEFTGNWHIKFYPPATSC